MKIPGYKEISRRDRSIKENSGGIITYARNDVQNVVHLFNSSSAERSWHLIHFNIGTYAMANWYRPGADDGNAIRSFRIELQEIMSSNLGVLVLGDLNIHHVRWLRHSTANTCSGAELQEMFRL